MKLLAKIFGWPVVYTFDYDSERRIRRMYNINNTYFVKGIDNTLFSKEYHRCEVDGTIFPSRYVKTWTPVNSYAAKIFLIGAFEK